MTTDSCGCTPDETVPEKHCGCNGPLMVALRPGRAPVPKKDRVPKGGTAGQVLAKASDADGDTHWVTPVTPEEVAKAVTAGTQTVGQALLGPAEDMAKLKPGGALFITDGRDPITEELQELRELVAETNATLDGVLDGETGGEDSGQDQGGEQGGDPGEAQAAAGGV